MDKWISVKERLPEDSIPVWLTICGCGGGRWVRDDCYYLVDGDIDADEGPGFYICFDREPYWAKIKGAVAWMPYIRPNAYTGD